MEVIMQINEECIRDILSYLVDNLEIVKNIDNKYNYEVISVLQLIETSELNNYSPEVIIYSVNILSECGFIEGEKLQKKTMVSCADQDIINVTYMGQQFYEAIKPESVWKKTKSIVGKVGVHTLGFIENTAQMIATESAKQAVTISMMKQG